MEFFMGFLTSSILSTIFFCVYIFLKEEVRKNRYRNIIPGQTYYVQSIGKVIVQSVDYTTVSYMDDKQNLYKTSCDAFLTFSKLSLKETGPIGPIKIPANHSMPKDEAGYKYYDSKGKIFDVYVD